MSFVVKNTTSLSLLDLLCPHSCRGCGALGEVLCERCKNYIIQEHTDICPHCRRYLTNNAGICEDCKTPFSGFWVVGWRKGALAKLVSDFKYQSVRACGDTLAELLDRSIPTAVFDGQNVAIVPLPTIGKHIRSRGFDHTKLLGKKIAKRRGWKVVNLLERITNTTQVGTSATDRQKQAATTYALSGQVDKDTAYLLLDDVWTTGASMQAAAKILKRAGVKQLYGAVTEIGQPKTLDKETI